MRHHLVVLLLALVGTSASSAATSPEECAPGEQTDALRLLRQISLDVRGRIPTLEEYAQVEAIGGVDAATLDGMFASPDYFAGIRTYHRALVWGGLGDDTRVVGNQRLLNGGGATPYFVNGLQTQFRGRNGLSCLDQLQTQFDAAGRPEPIERITDAACRGGFGGDGTCVREGYVMVRPYWSDTQVKVCAFDAQSLATGIGTPAPTCDAFTSNRGCGCGPGLRYCATERDGVSDRFRAALAEEAVRIFDMVIREDRSYFDAFTTRQTFVNGPLRHFYTYLAGEAAPLRANNLVGYDPDMPALPALAFGARDTWIAVNRGPSHAGALTTAGFLLRMASNRSRVNRFYTAFRCEPFLPLADGLPPDSDGTPDPNLRTRAGCADCHERIEPAAAHWGRWRTQSQFGHVASPAMSFTAPTAECRTCGGNGQPACSAYCNAYFVTPSTSSDAGELAMWRGFPQARAYLSEAEAAVADLGPSALVDSEAEQARVATCTVRTLAEHLLGRPLAEDEAVTWLPEATAAFAASGHRFTALYRSIIELPQYRINR
jgi:hypothetical protein